MNPHECYHSPDFESDQAPRENLRKLDNNQRERGFSPSKRRDSLLADLEPDDIRTTQNQRFNRKGAPCCYKRAVEVRRVDPQVSLALSPIYSQLSRCFLREVTIF